MYEYYHRHLLEGALLLLASSIGMAVYLNVDLAVSRHDNAQCKMMAVKGETVRTDMETLGHYCVRILYDLAQVRPKIIEN